LLAKPLTVTTTFPDVAEAGTGTTMLVALQLVGVAAVLLNVTVLVPCEAPKFETAFVPEVPAGPLLGARRGMVCGTAKATPLLAIPLTVTTTLPLVAPAGTGTTTLVAVQLVGVAVMPLNVTVLVPCEAPKFEPAMVTEVPTAPLLGVKLLMIAGTMKLTPLLA